MLLIGIKRRQIVTGGGGGGGALPSGPYYTENSAIFHDPTNFFSNVFQPPYFSNGNVNGAAGTVDTTKTASMTANAGGSGVHAFNPSGASGVRWRSNYFVVQPGSTSVTFSVGAKNYTGESGKKIALAIYCTTRAIATSTNTTPIRVTVPKHGRETGDTVQIAGHYNKDTPFYYAPSNANGTWTVTKVDNDTLELQGSIGNGNGFYNGYMFGDTCRASTTLTLTGSMTTGVLNFSSAVTGCEYEARISNDPALGADSAARAFLGNQSLTCTGATGIFNDYVRLQWMPSHWQYDLEANAPYVGYWAYASGRGQEASTHAFLETTTNADSLVVETASTMYGAYNVSGYTIAASSGFTAKVDNSLVDVKSTRDTSSELLTLPLPGTLSNVKIYNVGRNNIASGWVGSHYRAIYIPRGKAFTLGTQPAATSRVVVTVGDSITSGFAAQPMSQYAWPSQLRTLLGCDVYDDGTGGIISFAFSGASASERANKVAQVNPTDITLALGTNDWQQENAGLQSLDNYELYMGQIIDAFHTAMPSARVHVLAIWNKTSYEGSPGGFGHTIDDFRRRLIKLVVDRGSPSWLRIAWVKDWTVYSGPGDDYRAMPVGMIDELVHPNNQGMTKMANKAAALIPSSKLSISPATFTLAHSTGHSFSASGGSGTGYTWSLWQNQSGGSVTAGVYTAGGTAGTDVIQVMDSIGQMGFSVVTVT